MKLEEPPQPHVCESKKVLRKPALIGPKCLATNRRRLVFLLPLSQTSLT
jgi:hypothetical protein